MPDEKALTPSPFNEHQRRLRLVLDCVDFQGLITVPEISAATGLAPPVVQKALNEIMKARMDGFKSKPMQALVSEAANNYLMQTAAALRCLTESTTQLDKRGAIKLLKDVQDSQNQLYKMCGLYREVKELQISIREVAESEEGKQFVDLFLDFLAVKGIDPAEFKTYSSRRANGEFQPIELTERGVHPNKGFSDSGVDNIGEFTKAHAKEQIIKDATPISEYIPGITDVSEEDLTKLDVDDLSIAEAKLMTGTLEPDEEAELLDNLTDEGKADWTDRKAAIVAEAPPKCPTFAIGTKVISKYGIGGTVKDNAIVKNHIKILGDNGIVVDIDPADLTEVKT